MVDFFVGYRFFLVCIIDIIQSPIPSDSQKFDATSEDIARKCIQLYIEKENETRIRVDRLDAELIKLENKVPILTIAQCLYMSITPTHKLGQS